MWSGDNCMLVRCLAYVLSSSHQRYKVFLQLHMSVGSWLVKQSFMKHGSGLKKNSHASLTYAYLNHFYSTSGVKKKQKECVHRPGI